MPELLIELFSEEIPARMQKRAEEDLARALKEKLAAHGLDAAKIETFTTPRRLGCVVRDLPAKAADVNEERKGPRTNAPAAALQGFLKSAGLSDISQAQIVEDKKGDFYVARIARQGRATPEIVQDVLPEIIRAFPWPKSMRSRDGDLQWVRPLRNICVTFDAKPVRIDVAGVPSEAITWGHRFHSAGAIPVTDFISYERDLRAARVMLSREQRKQIILDGARAACSARGFELVEDIGLLEEVAGLVEWPVPLIGDMDPAFLDLPGEVIRLTMRTHQKYFAVRDTKTGRLAPHFVTVANIEAKDGGQAIATGNARVLSARLNDARFFWDQDRKTPLFTEARVEKLKQIVFHQKLGSVWDKVERVKALAVELCAVTGADRALVERAAELCKMDLVTETVGEFPELQGQIGRQLFALEGGNESVAAAIEDHYRPLGPNDRTPIDPVAVTLALADKLDTLVGFWAIDEKPTGSSDAYGLRRAALGLVRTVLTNDIRFALASFDAMGALRASLSGALLRSFVLVQEQRARAILRRSRVAQARAGIMPGGEEGRNADALAVGDGLALSNLSAPYTIAELLSFLADRLKVQLRDQGKRHDLVDAVFALGDDDLVRIVARVEALDAFLKTQDGTNLLAGYRRAANILRAEEKKNPDLSTLLQSGEPDPALFTEPAERALHSALAKARPAAEKAVASEDFAGAMGALAALRAPVDEFFDAVLVNAADQSLRENRLLLASGVRRALHAVADFSKIEGQT